MFNKVYVIDLDSCNYNVDIPENVVFMDHVTCSKAERFFEF